jgi:hypothetical protein
MIGALLALGVLIWGAKSLVVNGNSRPEIVRKGLPIKDRPLSGQSFWNSWDLKSNRANTNNPANLLMWPQAKYFTPNADNMVNQGGGKEFMMNYKAMLDKDFHRTPKELNPDAFQRYPMSSQHGLRSTRKGVYGVSSSRQHVLGEGIGFSHMNTGGKWVPHSQGIVNPSSYKLDLDLGILHDDLLTGHRPDQEPSRLFGQKQLFLRA